MDCLKKALACLIEGNRMWETTIRDLYLIDLTEKREEDNGVSERLTGLLQKPVV